MPREVKQDMVAKAIQKPPTAGTRQPSPGQEYARWNTAKHPFAFRCTILERATIKEVAKSYQRFAGPFCRDIIEHVFAGNDPRAKMEINTTEKDIKKIKSILRKGLTGADTSTTMNLELSETLFQTLTKTAEKQHRSAGDLLYWIVINVLDGRSVEAAVNLE